MQHNSTTTKIEELIEPLLTSLGYELWGCEAHLNSKHALLRIYIDSPQGITLDDCSKASHAISAILDVENPIEEAYSLEVSSPGVNRSLFKLDHFKRYIDKRIKLKLNIAVSGRRNVSCCIKSVNDNNLVIETGKEEILEIPIENIERANLT